MIRLVDGAAEGAYQVKRAPIFLRAVVLADRSCDVLDQVDDEPRPGETVYVYERVGEAGTVHLNFGGRNRGTGFYATGEYRYLPDIDGETLRDTAAWREWATSRKDGG